MKASPRFKTGESANSQIPLPSETKSWGFAVGSVTISLGVAKEIDPGDIYSALARHAAGDWGDITEEDRKTNAQALAGHGQIASAHHSASKKFWIVTDDERRQTKILSQRECARLKAARNS